jgi:very-short-patch-repair endonuclease
MRDPEALAFRRTLRRASTDAERALWRALRAKRLSGAKFRRQHTAGPYVLDFYCAEAELCVEADGGRHFTDGGSVRDAWRGAYLAARGITVVRFTDREILLETDAVVEAIWFEVHRRLR